MAFRIVPIVEGHGERFAVPVLFRRIIAELDLEAPIEIGGSIRRPRGTLLKTGGLESDVELAVSAAQPIGAVFVLLDSEGDCPAQLGPDLLQRAQLARPDQRISVVLAHQEFESWFLAAASSLTRISVTENHHAPESIHGCKEWLNQRLPRGSRYSETVDQVAFAATFDLALARRNSPSFDKFWREVEAICQYARALTGNT